jgi:hypothetical protein
MVWCKKKPTEFCIKKGGMIGARIHVHSKISTKIKQTVLPSFLPHGIPWLPPDGFS